MKEHIFKFTCDCCGKLETLEGVENAYKNRTIKTYIYRQDNHEYAAELCPTCKETADIGFKSLMDNFNIKEEFRRRI